MSIESLDLRNAVDNSGWSFGKFVRMALKCNGCSRQKAKELVPIIISNYEDTGVIEPWLLEFARSNGFADSPSHVGSEVSVGGVVDRNLEKITSSPILKVEPKPKKKPRKKQRLPRVRHPHAFRQTAPYV